MLGKVLRLDGIIKKEDQDWILMYVYIERLGSKRGSS